MPSWANTDIPETLLKSHRDALSPDDMDTLTEVIECLEGGTGLSRDYARKLADIVYRAYAPE